MASLMQEMKGTPDMANITLSPDGLRVTDADYNDLRVSSIAAHETPALFASVAEITETSEDHEEFETDDSVSVSAYSSPLALWEMKTGQYTPVGAKQRGLWSRIKWGVIDAACEERAIETRRPAGVYLHPTMDFMSSRIDREASEDGGATWVPLIAFNVAGTMADTWRNALGEWTQPEYVELQAQHHMAVMGADRCFVVALFGGVQVRFFVVERDEELVEEITLAIEDFWAMVESKTAPKAGDDHDAKVISRLNAKILPDAVIKDMRQDVAFLALIEQKDALSKKANALKREIDAIKAQITLKMDGVSCAVISDTKQLIWVTVADKMQPAQMKSGYTYVSSRKISEKAAGPKLQELLDA